MGLFDFFKKKQEKPSKKEENQPVMADLAQNPLQIGDVVEALRYNLGKCQLVQGPNGLEYESLETGERISWLRMIDASTQLQKVKKINAGS
jgi:hypothetical protein